MYNAISTAGTGLTTYHTWLDVIANNIANLNDTTSVNGRAFTEHYLQAGEIATDNGVGAGVEAQTVTEKPGNGTLVVEPNNPLADARGYVRRADVDLSEQMGEMIAAQRAFQANANVVDRAKDVYEAAIQIGKGL